ncbi:hypothetical protein L198_02934 [Cryptococcus wingfieldii CBS 7118]|uniref:Mid2 domain-containing protein n=1 Tax=Cryptococcus wingfieldii CBS 7118 TaxID=1295528 RepID=A0A1E3JIA1_9TREE|nr:hypothetical protein L198_02934 [Cryptococcus wingfieldii CBS 7118]ODO00614.1 hypothetical protein L198_02934 [Cryptococcus wingfieldii CBS 7118]
MRFHLVLLASLSLSTSIIALAVNNAAPKDHLAARTALPKMNIATPAQYADNSTGTDGDGDGDDGTDTNLTPDDSMPEQEDDSDELEKRLWPSNPWWDWWKPNPTSSPTIPKPLTPQPEPTEDCEDTDGTDGGYDWVWLNERGEEVSRLFGSEREARWFDEQLERHLLADGAFENAHLIPRADELPAPTAHPSSQTSALFAHSSSPSSAPAPDHPTSSPASSPAPAPTHSSGITSYTHGSAPIQTNLPDAGNNKSSNPINIAVLVASILLIVFGTGLIGCILWALWKAHKRRQLFGSSSSSGGGGAGGGGLMRGGDEERVYQSGTPINKSRGDWEKGKFAGDESVDYSYAVNDLSYGGYGQLAVDSPTPVTGGKRGYDIQEAFERKRKSDELRYVLFLSLRLSLSWRREEADGFV